MPAENVTQDVEQVTGAAEEQLAGVEHLPFSPAAFETLKDRIAEYINNLVTESIKLSKRHQADTVSSNHVDRAAQYLVSVTARRFFRHLGTVGGILLGASLSNILSMAGANSFSSLGVVLSAVLGIAGAFMIALHMGKE